MQVYTYKGHQYFSEHELRKAMPNIVFSTLTEDLVQELGITIEEWAPPPRDPGEEELEALQQELAQMEALAETLRAQYVQATMLQQEDRAQEASAQLKALLTSTEME